MAIDIKPTGAELDSRAHARKKFTYAIITPTYYVDFEHCCFLVETVNRHVPEDVPHYLVIDRADRALFAPLASSRTRVVLKEDILRGRLRQVPFARRWWVGPRTPPVRGWIVQQLTKLFINRIVEEDVLIFVDSGCFFIKPFDPQTLVRDGRVRLFCETGPYFRNKISQRWHGISTKLLGIRPLADFETGYVSQLITWRRDNLIMLQRHLERVIGRPPLEYLARQLTMSEYYLYGTYCDLILAERSGHFNTPIASTLCYWGREVLSETSLEDLRGQLRPEHLLVLVDEKSRTPLTTVRRVFDRPQL